MTADLRSRLVDAARATVARGLSYGTTGNVSVRTAEGMLISPTGWRLDALTPASLVAVGPDGRVTGPGEPSSEWRLHRDIYRARPEAGAVVHAHPRFATTLSCLRLDLPPVHYMLAAAGPGVRCAAYATFGTEALSTHAVAALEGRRACLLANHGLVAFGTDPEEAVGVALEVEMVAEYFWRARAVGEPVTLSAAEMDEVMARFAAYRTHPEAGH